jgi:hypothetical protein
MWTTSTVLALRRDFAMCVNRKLKTAQARGFLFPPGHPRWTREFTRVSMLQVVAYDFARWHRIGFA